MQGLLFLLWSIASPTLVWYLMRRRIRAEQLRLVADNERLRDRNITAAADLLEAQATLEHRDAQAAAMVKQQSHLAAELRRELEVRAEAQKRAEVAEGIVRGQAKHMEALQRSNETMLQAITDMRRTGFSLPSDILNAPDPDVITTVQDDDLQALKDYPHLAAADED